MSTRCLLIVCVAAGLLRAEQVLRIDQIVRGADPREPDGVVSQRLWMTEDKLRLDQAVPGTDSWTPRYVLRADEDPPFVYELFEPAKTYKKWEELNDAQRNRAVTECLIVEGILRGSNSAAEQEQKLADEYLRADLTRMVEVKTEPNVQLTVGGRSFECRHVLVVENGLAVLDALVTDQIGRGMDYYRFYRHLGVFSDEVLAKTKEIKGFPLKVKLAVVIRLLNKKFQAVQIEVKDVAETSVEPSFFEIPSSWKLEERKPLTVPCAWPGCRTTVETANPGGRFDYLQKSYYFCCEKCKTEFVNEVKAILKRGGALKAFLDGASTAGGTPPPPSGK